jgi:hypothetical protein
MTQGLILFAHGARDPRWAAPFEAVAGACARAARAAAVRLAFLEFMTPDLPEAAAELAAAGCTRRSTWCRCSWAPAATCARTCRAAGRPARRAPGTWAGRCSRPSARCAACAAMAATPRAATRTASHRAARHEPAPVPLRAGGGAPQPQPDRDGQGAVHLAARHQQGHPRAGGRAGRRHLRAPRQAPARVTEPGQQVLQSVEIIMREVANLKRIGDEFQAGRRHAVDRHHAHAGALLPARAGGPAAPRFPKVQVVLHQGMPEQVARMLLDDVADIGLATEALAATTADHACPATNGSTCWWCRPATRWRRWSGPRWSSWPPSRWCCTTPR